MKKITLLLILVYTAFSTAQVVTTIAGSSDGAGSGPKLSSPQGVATDASGNVYAIQSHRIIKITPTGVLSTLAGSTTLGYVDGIGAAAKFNNPNGVATDATGNVYVADSNNQKIRKITPDGVVTTLASIGTSYTPPGGIQ